MRPRIRKGLPGSDPGKAIRYSLENLTQSISTSTKYEEMLLQANEAGKLRLLLKERGAHGRGAVKNRGI